MVRRAFSVLDALSEMYRVRMPNVGNDSWIPLEEVANIPHRLFRVNLLQPRIWIGKSQRGGEGTGEFMLTQWTKYWRWRAGSYTWGLSGLCHSDLRSYSMESCLSTWCELKELWPCTCVLRTSPQRQTALHSATYWPWLWCRISSAGALEYYFLGSFRPSI